VYYVLPQRKEFYQSQRAIIRKKIDSEAVSLGFLFLFFWEIVVFVKHPVYCGCNKLIAVHRNGTCVSVSCCRDMSLPVACVGGELPSLSH
jgi:hypothetical protein